MYCVLFIVMYCFCYVCMYVYVYIYIYIYNICMLRYAGLREAVQTSPEVGPAVLGRQPMSMSICLCIYIYICRERER